MSSLLFSLQLTEKIEFFRGIHGLHLSYSKRKANAKGNGDWHLRGSRFLKKRYERIFKFYHLSMLRPGTCRFFLFFCSCMWREDSKHAVGFSFPRVAGDTATKCSWGFYCGPFCKTVRFSLLVISAAIQKERKDRSSVLSGLRL